jgi:16S rRNA A1518/A1519 N6-dimethyltransferase RsmA/KsgA/DIM1 with predicted DNA glycosylase/AP lyase activity
MFGIDFFPSPQPVIERMLAAVPVTGKTILEPSAGSGSIVDYLNEAGAKQVLACEIDNRLRKILSGKCNIIGVDFLEITALDVSHIDLIIMQIR